MPDLPTPSAVEPYLQAMHERRWYSNFGPLVTQFEREMAQFLRGGEGQAVSFSSATTALELAIRAMGLREGANVLVPALTFPATALAVINAGLRPVFCDVDAESWVLTPDIAEAALQHTSVDLVMPVATFGKPLDAKIWLDFQKSSNVPVLLDAAAALGQQAVVSGVNTVFSLHATKPFGVGEGGLLVTSDADLARKSRSLSNFGFQGTGEVLSLGTNAKMGEYYAAVGLAQIQRFEDVMASRRTVLSAYLQALKPYENSVGLQQGVEEGAFIPAVFPIYMQGKAPSLTEKLQEARVQIRHWYLPPLYRHKALAGYDVIGMVDSAQGLPVCEDLAASLVGLPFHAFLKNDDIELICQLIGQETGSQA